MMRCWRLRRRGSELEVDVDPGALVDHEEDAIIEALEGEIEAEGLEIVHLTGSVLDDAPTGTIGLIRRVGKVADLHHKHLSIGPI